MDTINQPNIDEQILSEWHYELNGKRIGPINDENLKNLIHNQTLNSESSIWRKDYDDWKKIKDTEL